MTSHHQICFKSYFLEVFHLDDFRSSGVAVLRVHDVTSRVANALPLQIPVICKPFAEACLLSGYLLSAIYKETTDENTGRY